jgi:hypothetical protein
LEVNAYQEAAAHPEGPAHFFGLLNPQAACSNYQL